MNFGQSPYSMPPAVKNLIIINVIFFLACIVFDKVLGISLEYYLGLHIPMADNFHIYQFATYMFLHAYPSFSHIFFNMFALFMFGRMLEMVWGSKKFLIFYFVTGMGAGVIQELTWIFELREIIFLPNEYFLEHGIEKAILLNRFVTVGASGAVFGLLLAFGMLFPDAQLMLIFPPISLKAKYFVLIYGAIELFLGVSGRMDSVAHFAHLGGMLFGFFLIRYWKKTGNMY